MNELINYEYLEHLLEQEKNLILRLYLEISIVLVAGFFYFFLARDVVEFLVYMGIILIFTSFIIPSNFEKLYYCKLEQVEYMR